MKRYVAHYLSTASTHEETLPPQTVETISPPQTVGKVTPTRTLRSQSAAAYNPPILPQVMEQLPHQSS